MRIFSFFIRFSICCILIFVPLSSLDQWFYDHFFKLRGKKRVDTEIVLVKVSDTKILQLLEKDPVHKDSEGFAIEHSTHSLWYKPYYDKVIENIEKGQPKVIVFTPFYEWVIQKKTEEFKQNNLIFSSIINQEDKLILPPRKITKQDIFGFNNIFPDSDNVVRRSSLLYSSGESLALATYKKLHDTPITRDLIPPLLIDYRGPSGSYKSYDGMELFEGAISPDAFKDKIVLIGREGSPNSNFDTPFGLMSSLEIHANIIDTFFSKKEIRFLHPGVGIFISSFVIIISILIIFYFPLTIAWIILLLLSLVLLLCTLFFFAEVKLWPGIANPLLCIFGTHLLMLGYRLSREEEKQWKIQQETSNMREMDQFKNNFISLFSHDLKTPIAKIKAVTDRILTEKKDTLTPDIVDAFKTIDRTNAELARFISDILKVTKMESMSLELRKEVVDINRVVETTVQRLKFLSDEKNIKIILDLEPLFSIEGDEQLIQEVVLNLVENAIKYSPKDKEVVIRTRELEDLIQITVQDQGMGIPPEEIPRVTSKFYRGQNTREVSKGSGLGLYLSKYFVELHRGTLTIKSTVGKGTEVVFTLPLPKA